jgi:hypothetical protein
LKEEGWQLVLLVDEIDRTLHHDGLSNAGFFGGLRSVASRSSGALAVVLASRLSQRELDARTQPLWAKGGSPYFNVYRQVTLGSLPEEHVEGLVLAAGRLRIMRRAKRTSWITLMTGAPPPCARLPASSPRGCGPSELS